MSQYKESFSDTDIELMPEGVYEVQVRKSSIAPSKSTNRLTWCLEFEVKDEPHKGKKLWYYTGMSEGTKKFRKANLTALGLSTDKEVDLIDDVEGLICNAEVMHDTFKGEKRERIMRLRTRSKDEDTDTPF